MNVPNTSPPAWPGPIGSGRFAARIEPGLMPGPGIALLGMPDDTGVGLNGGRLGARDGPSALRAALARYGSAEPSGFAWPSVCDAGDVEPAGDDLHESHRRVTEAVRVIMEAGRLPLGIGGGHDLTYPFVRGVQQAIGRPMAGVYFDAHLDVREEIGSGMPFRRLIEGGHCERLDVHGLDAMANSREHIDWFCAHGGRVDPHGPSGPWPEDDVFVSFDLDVIDQSCAPGVSAMNPAGWSPAQSCVWVRAAGQCDRVRCFDVMELSPPNDEQGRTARLAARLVLEFIRGFAERGS